VSKTPECNVKADPPWLMISISGYFSDILGKKLTEAAREAPLDGVRFVIFDFSDCPVVNSTGLAALICACEVFQDEHHLEVGFCRMSNLLLEAFQISGMNQVGALFATVEEAKVFFGS